MSDSEDDFFALLGKSISKPVQKNENICLISLEPLEKDYIKLECGHCFNYMCLFEEYKNQSFDVRTKNKLFCCPYCRTIQKYELPMRSGVIYDKMVHQPIKDTQCVWEFKTGKKKGEKCGSTSKGCYNDGYYCMTHCKSVIKNDEKKKVVKKKVVENEVIDVENEVIDVENEVVDKVEKTINELSGLFGDEKLYDLQNMCKIMLATYRNKDKQYVKPAIYGLMATMGLIFGKYVKYESPEVCNIEMKDKSKLDELNVKMKIVEGEEVKILPANATFILKMSENSVIIPLKNLSKLMDIKMRLKNQMLINAQLEMNVKMIDYIKMMNPS